MKLVILYIFFALQISGWAQFAFGQQSNIPHSIPPEITGQNSINPDEQEDTTQVVTIENLLNNLVLSASNREESARTAPAWVITLTRKEIAERGYQELSDLFNDLPGIDVIRPHGDTYFRTYWRGHRTLIGSSYLLLVDGLIFNHLYLNEGEIIAALPLSAVERVEIVYGPASAIYGPNAEMGVINVITRAHAQKQEGVQTRAQFKLSIPTGSNFDFKDMSKVADSWLHWQNGQTWLSAAARFDTVVLDPSLEGQFEYTDDQYYTERRFYGAFLRRSELAGPFRSENRKQAVDLRLGYGDTEVGFQRYRMRGGGGVVYPADRAPNRIPYVTFEQSLYLRHQQEYSQTFSVSFLLRYRESHIDSPTTWLEFDHAVQQVTLQYWQSSNYAYTASLDFSVSAFQGLLTRQDELVIDFGGRYERRDLERDYIRNGEYYWDPSIPLVGTSSIPSYIFPQPTRAERHLSNRDSVDTFGLYLLGRYQIVNGHYLNLGIRMDYNSFFGDLTPIFRGGYVGQLFPELTLKLLYGQALREPNRRVLFGGFSASGSNVELKRERSQTLELSIAYQLEHFAIQTNAWMVDIGLVSNNGDQVRPPRTPGGTSISEIVTNRLMIGADLSTTLLFPLSATSTIKAWVYYSILFLTEAETEGEDGTANRRAIGDLAQHKVLGGITADVHQTFSSTILGRCISDRPTVATNPIDTVVGYCEADLNLSFRDLIIPGIWFSIGAKNILDTQYNHPGIGSADSGDTPGTWQDGVWTGSEGYFNSLLPQPGRIISLQLGIDL